MESKDDTPGSYTNQSSDILDVGKSTEFLVAAKDLLT